ncbi:MAG: oligosaccharide flippase family protein [Armatimonadetes bacterium]|nr:oligosaccharide flippase family protein [Armatimonadota bacterium]
MSRIVKHLLTAFTGDAVARLLGFVATAWTAAALQPEGFGTLSMGLALLTWALWSVDLGLNTLGVRIAATQPEHRQFPPVAILRLQLVAAFAVMLLGEIILLLIPLPATLRAVMQLYLLYPITYALYVDWYHQGKRNYRAVTVGKFLSGGLYAGALLLLVNAPSQIALVPLLYIGANLIAAAALLLMANRADLSAAGTENEGNTRSHWALLREGFPILLGSIVGSILQTVPLLLLGFLHGPADAGTLGVVLRVVTLMMMADRVFVALYLPRIANRWGGNRDSLQGQLGRGFRLVVVAGGAIGAVATVHANAIIALLFGANYAAAGPALQVVAWYAVATLWNSYFAYALVGIGYQQKYMKASMVGGAVALPIIALSIWFGGLRGAAWGITIGEGVMVLLMYLQFRQHFTMPVVRPLVAGLAIAAATIAVGVMLGGELWFLPVSLLLPILLSWLTRSISTQDVAWLQGR